MKMCVCVCVVTDKFSISVDWMLTNDSVCVCVCVVTDKFSISVDWMLTNDCWTTFLNPIRLKHCSSTFPNTV